MARRRKISTTISTDAAVAQLSDFAALLYTWAIPHAEDDCTITSNPSELLFMVAPSRSAQHSIADVVSAVDEMCATDPPLVVRDEGSVHFDSGSFYKHQSYIPEAKRVDNSALFRKPRQLALNSANVRETAQKCASLSPSLSPSKEETRPDKPAAVDNSVEKDFAEWWEASGKNGSKADARVLYAHWRKTATRDDLLTAVVKYRRHCELSETPLKHGCTFLARKPNRWREWLDPTAHAPAKSNGKPSAPRKPICPECGCYLTAGEDMKLHCPECYVERSEGTRMVKESGEVVVFES